MCLKVDVVKSHGKCLLHVTLKGFVCGTSFTEGSSTSVSEENHFLQGVPTTRYLVSNPLSRFRGYSFPAAEGPKSSLRPPSRVGTGPSSDTPSVSESLWSAIQDTRGATCLCVYDHRRSIYLFTLSLSPPGFQWSPLSRSKRDERFGVSPVVGVRL